MSKEASIMVLILSLIIADLTRILMVASLQIKRKTVCAVRRQPACSAFWVTSLDEVSGLIEADHAPLFTPIAD